MTIGVVFPDEDAARQRAWLAARRAADDLSDAAGTLHSVARDAGWESRGVRAFHDALAVVITQTQSDLARLGGTYG